MINDDIDLWTDLVGETLVSPLNKLNTPNMHIPANPWQFASQQANDLHKKYVELLDKYLVLSDEYKKSMRDQKQALEKCIQYQNDINSLQDKYSKLQEEYIKLTHYVINDADNKEITKIKIG